MKIASLKKARDDFQITHNASRLKIFIAKDRRVGYGTLRFNVRMKTATGLTP